MREQRLAAAWARELVTVAERIGAFVARPESRERLERLCAPRWWAMRATTGGSSPKPLPTIRDTSGLHQIVQSRVDSRPLPPGDGNPYFRLAIGSECALTAHDANL